MTGLLVTDLHAPKKGRLALIRHADNLCWDILLSHKQYKIYNGELAGGAREWPLAELLGFLSEFLGMGAGFPKKTQQWLHHHKPPYVEV